MASFTGLSSPPFLCRCFSPVSPLRSLSSTVQFKKGASNRRLFVVPVKCSSTEPSQDADSEAQSTTVSSSSLSSSSSTYKWCAGIGAVGLLETAYLTYVKLSNSDVFCPIGGGNCGDILNSDYAVVFGVPLPLIGLVSYGFVMTLSLQLNAKTLPFGIDEMYGRLALLGSTTSMAAASAYFLYILSTKFAGASCSYCLMSALLSFSLFLLSVKDAGLQEIQRVVGLQLCIATLVILTLNTAYSTSQIVPTSLAEVELPFFTTEMTTTSSPFALSLARHLHSIGAKMNEFSTLIFGSEASKLLDYVECFPNGYKKGTKMAKACADAGIEGFPTWVIHGQVLSGEQELAELAEVSGFDFNE
ncbi:hypothetical protein SLA2020_050910 [Shorea laevis]